MDSVLIIAAVFAVVYLVSVVWHAGADNHTDKTSLTKETIQNKSITMKHSENEAYELIDSCNENINNGNVNATASYDEGVRDALLWLIEGTSKPFIGREN